MSEGSQSLSGIAIQAPWAELILRRQKKVETRTYPLPLKYVGKKMLIIETPGRHNSFKRRIIGVIIFGKSFKYRNETEFYSDCKLHLVTEESDFAWGRKKDTSKWGWPILFVEKIAYSLPASKRIGIIYTKNINLNPVSDGNLI